MKRKEVDAGGGGGAAGAAKAVQKVTVFQTVRGSPLLAFQKIAEFDAANVQKYVEFNQSFAARLPEVRDIQGFADLQREYGETLWNNTQEAFQARAEMVREATEAATDVVRSAWSTEEVVEEKKETKAKAAA